jgi:outer membrane immunogenic protein
MQWFFGYRAITLKGAHAMSSISRLTEFRYPAAAIRALALAVTSVAALTGSALAADLPVAGPPPAQAVYVPPAPFFTWTGCYVGGNVGYGSQNNHAYDPLFGAGAGSDTSSGFVGGGQIGCDWQTGPWVFGIQGMFDGTSLSSGSHVNPLAPTGADVLGTSTRWFSTQTGRVGLAVTPQALFYAKGGLAEASFSYTDNDPTTFASATYASPYFGSASTTRLGWTVGAGFEYSFAPNWSAFVEYNYMGFGSNGTTFTYTNATPYTYNETNNLQTVLVGVNFRFSPGGPLVARY